MNDLISKEAALNCFHDWIDKHGDVHTPDEMAEYRAVEALPTVDAVPVIRCKDCKHFDLDHWETINGIPLIVAHEICTFWGWGCKTEADGYCFKGERREE